MGLQGRGFWASFSMACAKLYKRERHLVTMHAANVTTHSDVHFSSLLMILDPRRQFSFEDVDMMMFCFALNDYYQAVKYVATVKSIVRAK